MSTHYLCFVAKIRKIGIPLHTPVLLYKVGFEVVHFSRTCFPDTGRPVAHTQALALASLIKVFRSLYLLNMSS